MFNRFTCGLIAQFSIVTSCEDVCRLARPGSPAGKRYDAWSIITATLRRSSSFAMMFARTKRSSVANVAAGSFESALEIANPPVRQRDHLLQSRFVTACEHAKPAAQVVVQHERPSAEELLGEELRENAVAFGLCVHPKQVVRVAVEHEGRSGAREIEIGELVRPGRDPFRKVGGATRFLNLRRGHAALHEDLFP